MHDEYLYLAEIADGIHPIDVQDKLTALFGDGVNLEQVSREVLVRRECAERIRQLGVSRALAMAGRLEEAVLKRGEAPTALAALVNGMLRRLNSAPSELLITDPYFFKSNKNGLSNYAALIDQLWDGLVDSVASLVVITEARHDNPTVIAELDQLARSRNGAIQFHRRTSDAFHDRFWIVNRTKGVLVGTSANGLGNRYAVADYLEETDVAEIVAELGALGLLPGPSNPASVATLHQSDSQLVAEAAYVRWRARGGGHGGDLEDWFEAERFLTLG